MTKLRVDIWSDIACPWCYVGKRHLEAALAGFEHRDDVEVVWRAFELDPTAERFEGTYPELLASKYGMGIAAAKERLKGMADLGARDGIDFRFDRARRVNTFDAHRLMHLGILRGVQNGLKERLLRAYMTEGADLSDTETLVRLATEAGLDAEEARSVVATRAYAEEVRADEAEANALGIHGVPFFVIGRYGISGAQPTPVLLEALRKAWAEVESLTVEAGAACGVDGCV